MKQSKTSRKVNRTDRTSKSSNLLTDKILATPISSSACLVHPDLQQYLSYSLYKTALRLRAMMAETFAPFGIIPPHFGIMTLLKQRGPVNQVTLGETMGIDKATMVKLIDGLEKLKYVAREASKEDRRVKFIAITDKGRKAFDQMLKDAKLAEKRFLSSFSGADEKEFRRLIGKLVDSARR